MNGKYVYLSSYKFRDTLLDDISTEIGIFQTLDQAKKTCEQHSRIWKHTGNFQPRYTVRQFELNASLLHDTFTHTWEMDAKTGEWS